MALEADFDDTVAYANYLIDHVRAATSVEAIGLACAELSSCYRAAGICELLIDADVDAFFHLLIHGALTRRYYLRRCIQEGRLAQPERRASMLDPLFDAMAANQFGLAREITAMSSRSRSEDFEDDVDFAYAGVVHAMVSSQESPAPSWRNAVDTYGGVLGEVHDERLAVCMALASADEHGFAEGFPRLIERHEQKMAVLRDSIRSNESVYGPNCAIYVEGLALLRIADRIGIRTLREYPLCPSLARLSVYGAFVPRSFPNQGLAL